MAPTLGDTIDRVFRWAPQQGRIDKLSSAIVAGSQHDTLSITPQDIALWGSPMEVEIGSEIFHVTSVDRGAGTASAIRGWRNTAADAHTSGDVCHLVPRFFRKDASDAIIDALRRMCPPLYKMTATTVTYASGTSGYELPAACEDVYRIWSQVNSSTQRWKELFSFDVAQQMDTDEFSTGVGLILKDLASPGPMRVQYKAKFTEPASEATDMMVTVGLEDFMLDIPVWYAVSVLLPPDEVMRTQQVQAVSQARAEHVEPRQSVIAAEYFRTRYEDALREATARMELRYPMRIRVVR